jgi:hypothetical protein
MTDQQFLTQLLGTYQQYVQWLLTSGNALYGAEPHPGVYGDTITPTFEGYIKWIELVYLPAQPPITPPAP